jgi:hypothetical protein
MGGSHVRSLSQVSSGKGTSESSNSFSAPLLSRQKGTTNLLNISKTGNLVSTFDLPKVSKLDKSKASHQTAVKLSSIPTGKSSHSTDTSVKTHSRSQSMVTIDSSHIDAQSSAKVKVSTHARSKSQTQLTDMTSLHASASGTVCADAYSSAQCTVSMDKGKLKAKAQAKVGATITAKGSSTCGITVGDTDVSIKAKTRAKGGASANATASASFSPKGFSLGAKAEASFGEVSGSLTVNGVGVKTTFKGGVSIGAKISSKGIDVSFLCFGLSIKW